MKLSKTFWLILIVVVLAAASVWVYMQYDAAVDSRSTAETNLSSAEQLHSKLVADEAGLNSQMAQATDAVEQWQVSIAVLQDAVVQAQAGLVQAQSQLPTSVDSLDYDELLLGFAHASGLEVLSLETSDEGASEVGGHSGFVSATFTINIKGTVSEILDLYNRITSDFSFRTGQVGSVVLEMPLPMTEEAKAILAEEFYSELLAELQDSFTVEEHMILVEQAILELLGNQYEHLTVTEMTQRIVDTLITRFDPGVTDQLAEDMALALEKGVSDALINIVAGIYGDAIGEMFTEGEPQLTPEILGILGTEITEELLSIPAKDVSGIVNGLIIDKLNAMIQARIEGMVDQEEIARRVAAVVVASQKATADISVTVTAYMGGSNG